MKHRVAVLGLIKDQNNKILISQRPEGKELPGYWEFPGGKVEENEDHLTALARELKEELGIAADPKSIKLVQSFSYSYPTYNVELYFYHVKSYQGAPLPIEGQQLAWVKREEFSKYKFLPANDDLVGYLWEF